MAGANLSAATDADGVARQLALLVRRYAETGSVHIAQAILRHIDLLHTHPAFDASSGERCAYLRLRSHWRLLAAITESRQEA